MKKALSLLMIFGLNAAPAFAGAKDAEIERLLTQALDLKTAISRGVSVVGNESARTAQSQSSNASSSVSMTEGAYIGLGIGATSGLSVSNQAGSSSSQVFYLPFTKTELVAKVYFPDSLDLYLAKCPETTGWGAMYKNFKAGSQGTPLLPDKADVLFKNVSLFGQTMYQLERELIGLNATTAVQRSYEARFREYQYWGRFSTLQVFKYYTSVASSEETNCSKFFDWVPENGFLGGKPIQPARKPILPN